MPSRSRVLLVLLPTCAMVAGCGGRLGPLVTDVHWGPQGELLVTRCVLEITGTGSVTTYAMHDCTLSTLHQPRSGAPAQPPVTTVPAPDGNSVDVAH